MGPVVNPLIFVFESDFTLQYSNLMVWLKLLLKKTMQPFRVGPVCCSYTKTPGGMGEGKERGGVR